MTKATQETLLGSDLGVRTEASELANALRLVIPFAQGSIASYHGVRLTSDTGRLTLEATNGDQKAITSLPVAVAREGAVVVPAKVLDGFIRSVEGAVEMKVDNDKLLVQCGSSSLDLKVIEHVEWPMFADIEGDWTDLSEVWAQLKRILWAEAVSGIDKEASHHSVHFGEGAAVVLCTNCLSSYEIPSLDAQLSANVPIQFVNTIMGAISGGNVEACFGSRLVAFRSGTTTWMTRVIVDSYPNWRQVARAKADQTLTVDRHALLTALKRTGLLPEESGFKRMTMQRIDNELILTATGPDVGTITDVITCGGSYNGPDLVMPIGRLNDLVKSSEADELTFNMAGDAYKHVQIDEGAWTAVITPLRPPPVPSSTPPIPSSSKSNPKGD